MVGSSGQKIEVSSRTPKRRLMNTDSYKGKDLHERRRKLKPAVVV